MLSSHLEKTLRDSYNLAYTNKHEYVTLEHLLLALIGDKDALSVLNACGVNISILQKQLEQFTKESQKSMKSVQDAALIGRNEVNGLQNKLLWPPKISELNPDNVQLENHLRHLLCYLLHGISHNK